MHFVGIVSVDLDKLIALTISTSRQSAEVLWNFFVLQLLLLLLLLWLLLLSASSTKSLL